MSSASAIAVSSGIARPAAHADCEPAVPDSARAAPVCALLRMVPWSPTARQVQPSGRQVTPCRVQVVTEEPSRHVALQSALTPMVPCWPTFTHVCASGHTCRRVRRTCPSAQHSRTCLGWQCGGPCRRRPPPRTVRRLGRRCSSERDTTRSIRRAALLR